MFIHVDDAAVVYVNGTEVPRCGCTRPPVISLNIPGHFDERQAVFTIPTALFVTGRNVIAVEVHQKNTTSSDLRFELELDGVWGDRLSRDPR